MPEKLTTKQRLAIDRQKMPEQNAGARAANFAEVNLGFTEQLEFLETVPDRALELCGIAPRCYDDRVQDVHPSLLMRPGRWSTRPEGPRLSRQLSLAGDHLNGALLPRR